ncbi:MAG: phosphoglucosamine mutase [candidate division Zixibacteria bacterium]|nr:phosphoglucosamine mutase [candidate division Zixibacteria bacterium]
MKKVKKTLMVSTSGIRGIVGTGLDPIMTAKYAAAFGTLLNGRKIVVGRDSRQSGQMFKMAVIAALRSVGCDVIDIGIIPTPTVEIAVTGLKAAGGICLTASHNPSEWNALKLFNKKGEFIDKTDLAKLNKIFNSEKFEFVGHKKLGSLKSDNSWIDRHIKQVLKLDIINKNKIKKAKLKIVVDAVNGAGSYALPEMLEALGIEVIRLNCLGDGDFVHKPEPTPANLKMLSGAVKKYKADLGMACDPDADRLALVDETGKAISEELTLTLAVKYVLSKKKGKVVVNLSTSRVTEDVASEAGSRLFYSPVGEANVIAGIRKNRAVIGGEGNGGVIYPAFHCGRDALVGGAIISALLAETKMKLSGLVGTLPIYYNIKTKAPLPAGFDRKMAKMKEAAKKSFKGLKIDKRDGLRFDFGGGWFQIRKSNTEPIYRLIVETNNRKLTRDIKNEIFKLLK